MVPGDADLLLLLVAVRIQRGNVFESGALDELANILYRTWNTVQRPLQLHMGEGVVILADILYHMWDIVHVPLQLHMGEEVAVLEPRPLDKLVAASYRILESG